MMDPNEALKKILQPGGTNQTAFPPSSRYYGIKTATLEKDDGKTAIYLRRRFCPQPDQLALLNEHEVVQGDRLDNLAATYIGDPEQFWRICDANGVLRPDELTETVGRRIRITLPQGIPGMSNV
ncbi:hypothetical protein [uncultured Desulfobacter sp.]|uniref:hypothetical protein n=1 Tax=uncultured Desulfobacter sp. TaxID=240139 RepID=UPI002AA80804|nr:hypothetical protein [uncultured Desulfobacter sp.]